MALIKCGECGIDLLVDGVEKFESKEVNARVDNCPNCGAGLMTKKGKDRFEIKKPRTSMQNIG